MLDVNLRLGDGYLIVEPFHTERLKKELTYWHRELEYDKGRMMRVVAGHYEHLYSIDSTDTNNIKLMTMPGFCSRVIRVLQEDGFNPILIDERTPLPQPDIGKAIVGLRDCQLEGIHNAIISGGGIISWPTGLGKSHAAAAIIRAFPHNELQMRGTPTVAVVSAETDIARKNYNDLKTILRKEREVGLVMGTCKEYSDDVQVITFDSLHNMCLDDIGIMIVDEVHMAATTKRIGSIMGAKRAMRWGLSATPSGRFDGSDLVTEGLFGPIVDHKTYQEGVDAGVLVPITVYWVECPEPSIGVDKYYNYKQRKSKYDYGAFINKNLSRAVSELMLHIPDSMQTLCIMPFLTQMNDIKGFAPNIDIVHGETSDKRLKDDRLHNLTAISRKDRDDIYDKFAAGSIRKILSTYVYKQGVNFTELSVVICPGGGGSAIVAGQIPGRASRAIKGKDASYIIEFEHTWDISQGNMGPLLRDDKSRMSTYKKLGFEQVKIKSIKDIPFYTP